ncbi:MULTISPECIES: glycine zipper domain-containing protein [Helicobacter]|uniref:glycine zipper domain-containing protein n=1 Tax=Helicobacter TaxID=209 RepID=UPI0006A18C16|nr:MULTISPECIES: glycine zipper domain-containing protein [Helicobacter]BEG56397.1 hypothetical protein NHP21005_00850 [Helicobacter sp. NHP21005]CRF45066.1 hypothetical protein HHE014_00130 [Helicobacter heilmannii]
MADKPQMPKIPKAAAGFAIGGFLGSMIPVVGTIVGAGVGAAIGGVLSLREKEHKNTDQ